MIYFFIKSYLTTLIAITVGALGILLFGLYLIYKINFKTQKIKNSVIIHHDVSAIAGDNIISTQLDLARAYIEIGQTDLAKSILNGVAMQGSHAQQDEARTLLGLM